ncbi:MAG: homocysteine S-methyltransferase family protein [Clostridia bacterium]|nr:homocysteine S-methyltransferase family protein [Clostridia bacterium]
MKFTELLKDHTVYLDGGMGTLLQEAGLAAGELPERWNLTHAAAVQEIHRAYFDAGSHVVSTNTFGANSLKFSDAELEEIIARAVENVRAAARDSVGTQQKFVALDIGPTGRMLKPLGDLDFEDAVAVFAKTVRLGVKYGVDLILIETMSDSYETKAALLAAKEQSELPVLVSCAYGADGKLMTGATPAAMVAMLEGMGADAIGVNCSLGPRALRPVVEAYLRLASVPVLLKPNAGLPRVINGRTAYDVSPADFADEVADLIAMGVRLAGGCCGTTPRYIEALVKRTCDIKPQPVTSKDITAVSSYTHAVTFGSAPVLIGERINPTGKKRFKEVLRAGDMDYILKEGITQEEQGVHILDVNVGLPELDEPKMLTDAVCALQAVTALPLQIDTSDPVAMEQALRRYNGKAMINSVSGKRESMAAVFPLAKKYGGLVVALTLDEQGIPATAEARVEIARKILAEAKKYGIDKKDLIFDPLALTVSADPVAALETLRAVELIRRELGCHTSLGVSNVSFGLPLREVITASFFTLALGRGLSAAIMNPYAREMMQAYFAYRALSALDENCADYIAFAQSQPQVTATTVSSEHSGTTVSAASELQQAVIKGRVERAAALTKELLQAKDPLAIVGQEIIPALDRVGEGFEKKTVYLPQLLMSAEAAKAAFEQIKARLASGGAAHKCAFVLATVKGDIHDIGKNIVKLLLENYGFAVTDLGRDVAPEAVVEAVVRLHAPMAGLSALMTTTVPAMEETVRQLRAHAPWCKILVGGAVLTPEYANAIGADHYARDAMEAVRYAEEIDRTLGANT